MNTAKQLPKSSLHLYHHSSCTMPIGNISHNLGRPRLCKYNKSLPKQKRWEYLFALYSQHKTTLSEGFWPYYTNTTGCELGFFPKKLYLLSLFYLELTQYHVIKDKMSKTITYRQTKSTPVLFVICSLVRQSFIAYLYLVTNTLNYFINKN